MPGSASRELRILQGATRAYMIVLDDLSITAERAAAANQDVPEYVALLERLKDEIAAARSDHGSGTPAAIARVVAELLGEAS